MSKLVDLLKPILLWFSESREVKKLVVELIDRYVKSTDNDIDDLVAATVRHALLGKDEE